ncbi:MAG: ABC transporter ATP-binding protein [Erysipelotrichaceae bacterium]|nr:ABC transporter ATP-binding protein [Erysipelotrichaceae bacterium]
MKEVLIEVSNMTMTFHSGDKITKALDDVSFKLYRGETLGVVGESGCGKTTLGRCLAGLLKADTGTIISKAKGHQIIFQDPYNSVDPYWTVESIVAEGLKNRKEAVGLLEKVGLSRQEKNSYPHELSGGQLQRVGIARALGTDPDFIVCDEPVSALDVSYQSKIISLLEDLQREQDLTYLFISHDLAVVRHIADRIMIMYKGQIMEMGKTDDIINDPVHPYTRFLLSAVPSPFEKNEEFEVRNDQIESSGCPFAPRCPYRKDRCLKERCCGREISEDHFVACFLTEE